MAVQLRSNLSQAPAARPDAIELGTPLRSADSLVCELQELSSSTCNWALVKSSSRGLSEALKRDGGERALHTSSERGAPQTNSKPCFLPRASLNRHLDVDRFLNPAQLCKIPQAHQQHRRDLIARGDDQ